MLLVTEVRTKPSSQDEIKKQGESAWSPAQGAGNCNEGAWAAHVFPSPDVVLWLGMFRLSYKPIMVTGGRACYP